MLLLADSQIISDSKISILLSMMMMMLYGQTGSIHMTETQRICEEIFCGTWFSCLAAYFLKINKIKWFLGV